MPGRPGRDGADAGADGADAEGSGGSLVASREVDFHCGGVFGAGTPAGTAGAAFGSGTAFGSGGAAVFGGGTGGDALTSSVCCASFSASLNFSSVS